MKEMILKKVSLMTVTKKQKEGDEPIIGFMRFDFKELGKEHVEQINNIFTQCPEEQYNYMFYAFDDNAIYLKNDNNELIKKERTKESIIGQGDYKILAELDEHQNLKVTVSFTKLKTTNTSL